MEIHSRALTTCEIAADGQIISLGFVDASGKTAAVKLPGVAPNHLAFFLSPGPAYSPFGSVVITTGTL
jgi:hypothetical protein